MRTASDYRDRLARFHVADSRVSARLICANCRAKLGIWPVDAPPRLLAVDAAVWERLGGVPHPYCVCGQPWALSLVAVDGRLQCGGCGRAWPVHRGLLVRPNGSWRTRCPRCRRDTILDSVDLDERLLHAAVRQRRRDPTLAV